LLEEGGGSPKTPRMELTVKMQELVSFVTQSSRGESFRGGKGSQDQTFNGLSRASTSKKICGQGASGGRHLKQGEKGGTSTVLYLEKGQRLVSALFERKSGGLSREGERNLRNYTCRGKDKKEEYLGLMRPRY